jgi:hypothetical protein
MSETVGIGNMKDFKIFHRLLKLASLKKVIMEPVLMNLFLSVYD